MSFYHRKTDDATPKFFESDSISNRLLRYTLYKQSAKNIYKTNNYYKPNK